MNFDAALSATVDYLDSAVAFECLEASPYWPKWDSPWWHMLLLHEMGETHRIPRRAMAAFVAAMQATPIKIFPIHPGELPEGADPYHSACHCQLGNVYRVLDAWGVDVDAELPWIGRWFLNYQMADGGLNCDETAYLVADECPSSMVGTIAAFEAITLLSRRPWSPDERRFLDLAGRFMIERQLIAGSATRHNAQEREAARQWELPCFPRFYHYDVIRGLAALVAWAERAERVLPIGAIAPVLDQVEQVYPDGAIRIERRCYEGHGTIVMSSDGSWARERQPARFFPLLDAVSEVGTVSPFLSLQWAATRRKLTAVVA